MTLSSRDRIETKSIGGPDQEVGGDKGTNEDSRYQGSFFPATGDVSAQADGALLTLRRKYLQQGKADPDQEYRDVRILSDRRKAKEKRCENQIGQCEFVQRLAKKYVPINKIIVNAISVWTISLWAKMLGSRQ